MGKLRKIEFPPIYHSSRRKIQRTFPDGVWRWLVRSLLLIGLHSIGKGRQACGMQTRMGKTQVAPKMKTTVPRMKLMAIVNSMILKGQ